MFYSADIKITQNVVSVFDVRSLKKSGCQLYLITESLWSDTFQDAEFKRCLHQSVQVTQELSDFSRPVTNYSLSKYQLLEGKVPEVTGRERLAYCM